MITIRKSDERGSMDIGWLKAKYSFSFARYIDRNHMGFRALRVLNQDLIAPDSGFDMHSHNDMEIVTYVIEGCLRHEDTLGNSSLITAGEVQRMSAGTGITHSEYNASATDPLRLFQIWIIPRAVDLKPGYEQKAIDFTAGNSDFKLLVSPDGREGSLKINQDVRFLFARLQAGKVTGFKLNSGRHAWIQVITGEIELNGIVLLEGDGAAISDETSLEFKAKQAAEILLIDLN